ncbi:hypothetical protein ENUP19_0205G0036 [Entamoeba nuttalli]|uniref:Transporter, auxin efflux carrier (AEC) family protein n=2 Tax=Entamoeba nuttalli TaxID=412467 RepID=K2HZC1_ENTNP|nr:transporter, auxin efflux carrier (AEC) family protein [Entamoeba nuttalli P19]EKE41775.1 transporter, auxin efflux carrier (AEC) family protein [Entamoeba nuttalli P19]|eukprot:XP_008855889.1 transporter, auxin efflux carrier (AEC) family protein [Entamoeba nuttalli P19]
MGIADQFGMLIFIMTIAFIIKIIWYRGVIREHSGLLMKVVFNMALPCIVLKALINQHSLDSDAWVVFMAGCIYEIVLAIGGFIIFRFIFKSEVPWIQRLGGCLGCNIGLFLFPILEILDGDHAISMSILFNLSNDFCCYCVIRPIYAVLQNTNKSIKDEEQVDIDIELKDEELKQIIPEVEHSIVLDTPSPSISVGIDTLSNYGMKSSATPPVNVKSPKLQENGSIITPDKIQDIGHSQQVVIQTEKERNIIDTKSKKEKRSTSTVDKKHLIFTILKSIFTSVPMYFYPLGYLVGLCDIPVPFVIRKVVTTVASGNTLLAYSILGLFFEWKIPLKYIKVVLQVAIFKITVGLIVGLSIYLSTGNVATHITRVCVILCCLCPAPSVNIIYCVEYNVAHLEFSSGIVNYTNFICFVTIMIVYSILA